MFTIVIIVFLKSDFDPVSAQIPSNVAPSHAYHDLNFNQFFLHQEFCCYYHLEVSWHPYPQKFVVFIALYFLISSLNRQIYSILIPPTFQNDYYLIYQKQIYGF